MTALTEALLAFQRSAPAISKDAVNPHFRNRFASLENVVETVRPLLNEHGLVLLQFPTITESGEGALRTCLVHAESDESVEDTMLLHAPKDDPQGQGSALTYARRYAILAILGLVADEDDDGQAAQRRAARSGAGNQPTGRENPAASPSSRDEAGTAPAPETNGELASPAKLAHIKALVSDAAKLRKTTQKAVNEALKNDGYDLEHLSSPQADEVIGKLERWVTSLTAQVTA